MDVALEAGAEDIKNEGDHFEVVCPMSAYDAVSQALTDQGDRIRAVGSGLSAQHLRCRSVTRTVHAKCCI